MAPQTRPAIAPPHPTRFLWWRASWSWFVVARRWWRTLVLRSVLEPVLYLLGLGFGLGTLVDDSGNAPGAVPYAAYVAAGVLAASAMQSAFGEASWPVLGAIKWQRQYHAQLATPLRVTDVLLGHLVFMLLRLVVSVVPFWLVMVAFGLVQWPSAVWAVPAAVLCGMAFAAPVAAFAATTDNDTSFALLLRFAIIPMFLFAGVFFPVSDLPTWVQPVVWATPLFHGVELTRAASLGTDLGPPAVAGHVAYLLLLALGGLAVAVRTYTRRLS
ncbi:ABC transporter permease [Aquipuribacter sp. MA13-6]|uniref:ABC transporter permease n=1 Tax=unclassified Aquipuribacter TaxID=2635084 RepID=UPI003EEEBB38